MIRVQREKSRRPLYWLYDNNDPWSRRGLEAWCCRVQGLCFAVSPNSPHPHRHREFNPIGGHRIHHFATYEDGFSKCADVMLHQRSLLSTVWLGEQALDLHPRQLRWLVTKQLTGHLIGHQDLGTLGIDGDDGFVWVASCRGEERELLTTSCPTHCHTHCHTHWGSSYIGNGEGAVESLCEGLHKGSSKLGVRG